MIKYDEKRAILQAVRSAMNDALNEQDYLYTQYDRLSEKIPNCTFQDGTEQAAVEVFSLLNGPGLAEPSWLPEGLDQIPDSDVRGALGLYNEAINHLGLIRASHIFCKTLSECN